MVETGFDLSNKTKKIIMYVLFKLEMVLKDGKLF